MSTSDRPLSRRDLDEVVRRAAQLAAVESDAAPTLSEEEVLQLTGEVGLPERHVRQALRELRTGRLGAPGRGATLVGRFFGPARIEALRAVPIAPASTVQVLDDYLNETRLLHRVRSDERGVHYRPAVDWASQVAMEASFAAGRHFLLAARSVEVRVAPEAGGGGSLVEVEVDPGLRSDAITNAVASGLTLGGTVGGVAGVIAGWRASPEVGVLVAVLVATVTLAVVLVVAGSRQRRRMSQIEEELDAILDRVQAGETVEPPPAAWIGWVERHFHGARKLSDGRREPEDGEMKP